MNALQQIEALRKEFSALQSKLDMARNQVIPKPEPPKATTCVCGHDTKEHETFGVCQVSECGCMGFESTIKAEPPTDPEEPVHAPGRLISSMPIKVKEASQPDLPAEVDAALMACWGDLQRAFRDSSVSGMEKAWRELHQRLASLWPKAGQSPNVEEIETVCPQCGHEHTAYYVAPNVQRFPSLGLGRLTRAQIVKRLEDAYPNYSQGYHSKVADFLLALQAQAKVSRAEIQTAIKDIHVMPLTRAVEQALKNLGMEVEDSIAV